MIVKRYFGWITISRTYRDNILSKILEKQKYLFCKTSLNIP